MAVIRTALTIGAASLVAVAALCTLLAWLAPVHAIFELLANFRMQLLLVAAVAALVLGAIKSWPWLLVALAVLAVNAMYMVPYWTPNADPVTDAPTAQVLQYNIYFGNNDFVAIAEVINDSGAAVVAVHELTNSQWAGLEPLLDQYPHRVVAPVSDDLGELGGGMALLSRSAITEVPIGASANAPDRPILAIETAIAGAQMTVIGLHPHASRFSSTKVSLRDAQLDAVVSTARDAAGPVLVLTDMNITPFSPDYKDFLTNLGWRDPHQVVGWNASWPSFAGPLGTPIDHIFVSNELDLHSSTTLDGAGSDHLAVAATISVSGTGG